MLWVKIALFVSVFLIQTIINCSLYFHQQLFLLVSPYHNFSKYYKTRRIYWSGTLYTCYNFLFVSYYHMLIGILFFCRLLPNLKHLFAKCPISFSYGYIETVINLCFHHWQPFNLLYFSNLSFGYFQVIQAVMFLTGAIGIKIAIAKILGIADDVSETINRSHSCWTQKLLRLFFFPKKRNFWNLNPWLPFSLSIIKWWPW